MSKATAKTEIMVSNGRIIDTDNSMFVLIDASKLSLKDEFMCYCPRIPQCEDIKRLITRAINKGIKDYYKPLVDPSVDENGKIYFKAGNKPALGHYSYNWWEKKAKEFCPDCGSRLGTKLEYVAFLGVFIKSLVETGWNVTDAWGAVCYDSKELGNYRNSKNARLYPELTGSREVCGFYDLANAYKILAADEDEESGVFWLAGGCFANDCSSSPVADLCHYNLRDSPGTCGVGWLVLSA